MRIITVFPENQTNSFLIISEYMRGKKILSFEGAENILH